MFEVVRFEVVAARLPLARGYLGGQQVLFGVGFGHRFCVDTNRVASLRQLDRSKQADDPASQDGALHCFDFGRPDVDSDGFGSNVTAAESERNPCSTMSIIVNQMLVSDEFVLQSQSAFTIRAQLGRFVEEVLMAQIWTRQPYHAIGLKFHSNIIIGSSVRLCLWLTRLAGINLCR